jgi:hypothetical protein
MKDSNGVRWAQLVGSFTGSRTEVRALVDYCKFFTGEDAMRWALAAYLEAAQHLVRSEGPWVEGGVPWSSPEDFAKVFREGFERRVWDVCERSARFREVRSWSQELTAAMLARAREILAEPSSDLLHAQMPTLPPSKNPSNNALDTGAQPSA